MKLLRKLRATLGSAKKIANTLNVSVWKKIYIICDILFCKAYLHCTPEEYQMYELFKYKNSYRKNFIFMYNKITDYRKINPRRFTMHKKFFYKLIKRGIHREYLYLPEADKEQFIAFVKKHKKIITKPDVGSRGKNIQLFEYNNEQQAIDFFNSIKEETICEEYICQHEKLSSLNPNSVNSIRIVSLLSDNDITFISASLKSGGHKTSFVDNMHSDGVGANVDIGTGVVTGVGYDYNNNTYIYHPVTGTQIVGFSIPFWTETLELIKRTHADVPECPLIGWDVAITDKGPEIIEINGAPGPKLMQLMDQKPKRLFLKDYIKKHNLKKDKPQIESL